MTTHKNIIHIVTIRGKHYTFANMDRENFDQAQSRGFIQISDNFRVPMCAIEYYEWLDAVGGSISIPQESLPITLVEKKSPLYTTLQEVST